MSVTENATPRQPKRERPAMKNYGIATDDAGLMDWSWAEDQLRQARNYWVATTRADGRPHVAPVWAIWLDGMLYFSSHVRSVKGRNLAARPDVVVHLESGDDVVIVEGRAEAQHDMRQLAPIGPLYEAKYGLNPLGAEAVPDSVWYVVRPHMVYGWLEKDFPNTATRWIFEEQR